MVRFEDTEVAGPLTGLHLLVVDDNRDARVIYKTILSHCGAFVTAVSSAAAAARALRQIQPDVILTDLSMPLVKPVSHRDLVRVVAHFASPLSPRQSA